MKKLIITMAIALVTAVPLFNSAQTGGIIPGNTGGGIVPSANECVNNLFAQLFDCLSTYGATGEIVTADQQYHLYVQFSGNDPVIRGQIQNCVADYNNSRNDCDDAPVMVIKKFR